MAGTKRKPIRIKKANAGKLRKAAGAKKGQKVPASKLAKLKKSKNPKTRARAQFAANARKWRKRGKKS
jgi:hypothetical protein